jgi:two-component system heavy metal sensor histidine kinase CusS
VTAPARWSISGRITRWLVITVVVVALTGVGVSGWFVRYSLEREVTALIEEEHEELALLVKDKDPTREEFERCVATLQSQHPSNRMAFRVWRSDQATPWGDFGSVELLTPDQPSRAPSLSTRNGAGGVRWRTHAEGERFVVGIAIDGTAQLSLFQHFWVTSLGLVGFTTLIALIGGAVVIRRSRRLLDDVAERARTARWGTSDRALHVEGAPDEIREISEGLAAMRHNIQQETERARLMATGMAHELGSPIQNLVVQSEVALMRERTNEEYRRLVESQLEELRDLAHGVGNLVALCSMDATASGQELEEFDLANELELRLRRERVHAERRGVELDVRCNGNLTVRGDREALVLALCNLVSNAIDWSPAGKCVSVTAEQRDERIEVFVEDAGPGIAPELREKVFEPFFRGPTAQGRRAGYGLGLSIARAAIEAQAGTIAVDSSRDGGARLRVVIARAVR